MTEAMQLGSALRTTKSGHLLRGIIFALAVVTQLLPSTSARAAVLRHTILESDSAESLQLSRVCYALTTLHNGRLVCLPMANDFDDGGHLQLDLGIKASAQAFSIANHVQDQTVDQDFLKSLFADNNFQTVSGVASVRADYGGTALTYTPLHVIGAFGVSNPGLPDVHIASARESVLRLSQTLRLQLPAVPSYELLGGISAFYYQRQLAYLDTDLFTASVQKPENLVQKKTNNGVDSDLALALTARRPFIPSLAVHLRNLIDSHHCTDCATRYFNIEEAFARSSSISVSSYATHSMGQSILGVDVPFTGELASADTLQTAVVYAYKLGKLECFASFAPVITSFGFLFESPFYRLGIRYTDEKQDNSILINRQKQTYAFTSFVL